MKRGAHRIYWSKQEDDNLTKYWKSGTKEEITALLPNRTWAALILRAQKLNLKRDTGNTRINKRKAKTYINGVSLLHRLLDETYESYYWMGFILADGHISKNTRLVICLAQKDHDYLKKFCKFIGSVGPFINPKKKCTKIVLADKQIMSQVCEKFRINHNKTYNMNFINITDDDLFLSLFAGFVDGDGRINKLAKRKDFQISIVGHKNSLIFFKKMMRRLSRIFKTPIGRVKIDKHGYARASISNTEKIKQIKKRINRLNLPLMKRKWDEIDLTYMSRYEISKKRRAIFKKMEHEGVKWKEIAKILGVSRSALYKYR